METPEKKRGVTKVEMRLMKIFHFQVVFRDTVMTKGGCSTIAANESKEETSSNGEFGNN